jgi:ubiquinol-cytochrome c reductase cytochrome c1 subunit
MSADVAAFLTWTAEPKMEERKKTGFWFLGFMIFATILAYLSKKQVWAGLKAGRKD